MRSKNFPLLLLPVVVVAAVSFYYWKMTEQRTVRGRGSDRAELIQSSLDQQFQKFSLTGFDETGKSSWKLEGDAAKIDPGQSIYLDQNVTLHLKDNTTVRTDHVQWSQDGGTMRTDALVFVDHQNAKVEGRGALGKPNEGFIQLNRDITMTINATTNLVCQGPLKIFYNLNTMSFFRKVKVTDLRGVLSANRMDVKFEPDQKKIKEIIAIGNVVIERGADTTRSRKAIYTVANGSIRLEGNPEITLRKGAGGLLDGAIRS